MIVYRELSSLSNDLGFSAKALYSVSNHIHSHYRCTKIMKNNGECRELSVPDDFLKAIQRKIVEKLLVYEDVSVYAGAYRYGTSIVKNAAPHLNNNTVLKLDIRRFFDHIIYPLVKEKVFVKEKYSEKNRILLSLLCLHRDALPQGAPTSPIISNIIMKDFDDTVGRWCRNKKIVYTRYCDDMTFSGDFTPGEVVSFVKNELGKMGFYLNRKKTAVIHNGQKKVVTGVVVNDKLNTPLAYRKKLRQELYYCKKYGVASHIKHNNLKISEPDYINKLLGRVNYVLSVDRDNKEMKEYKNWLLKHNIKK